VSYLYVLCYWSEVRNSEVLLYYSKIYQILYIYMYILSQRVAFKGLMNNNKKQIITYASNDHKIKYILETFK